MIFTDQKQINTDFLYADITYRIRGAVFNVYNELGFGHKEQVYQKALEKEFTETNLPFKREVGLNVSYKNEIVGNYRPLEFMPKTFETQLLHYLKTTGYRLGLLVNFGAPKLTIKRLLWSGGDYP